MGTVTFRQRLDRIIYFFPIQLIVLHLKRNHLLLFFWLILFGYVTGGIGSKYGIPYLFLSPEYMGESSFWSFLIVGFALGGFIMAFNIYSYVMHGFRFPFIATLAQPFYKFCINNFIIPALFIVVFLYKSVQFQLNAEFLDPATILLHCLAFVVGVLVFLYVSMYYFFRTNRDAIRIAKKYGFREGRKYVRKEGKGDPRQQHWEKIMNNRSMWKVETYLGRGFKIHLARESKHYHKDVLEMVFWQNHTNASIYELVMVISFLIIGSFREFEYLNIPAGGSILLVFTIILMVYSIIYSWFKKWTLTLILVGFLLINYLSSHFSFMHIENQAYGLNYNTNKAQYTTANLEGMREDRAHVELDMTHGQEVLNKWRLKNLRKTRAKNVKPKLILINTSGGGSRAMLWTVFVMQQADQALNGELFNHTQLITGSSGGMMGASYMREQYLQHMFTDTVDLYHQRHLDAVSADILNPILFSVATNDIFIRYQLFKKGEYIYTKDRAFYFEKTFNENTGFCLDKKLMDYSIYEDNSVIPTLIFSPTIVNDGRRLLISSQPISYLSNNRGSAVSNSAPIVEDIEFMRLFEEQDAKNLQFTSALRMNATFPYILPTVSLPSEPELEVMDAGIRDNFGLQTSLQYLYAFRNWISTNTSGVILLQIRDNQKDFEIEKNEIGSLWGKMTSPLGSFYGNFTRVQDYNQEKLVQYAGEWFEGPIDVVSFSLRRSKTDNVSLSWHLTSREKAKILASMDLPENQEALSRLRELVE